MYFSNQILRNKETNELAQLVATDYDGTFKWELGKNTLFRDELGNEFQDDIDNYTHVEDEFGRPVVDTFDKLKKYLISPEGLLLLREQSCREWEQRILKWLDTKDLKNLFLCFSDGSRNFYMINFWIKKYNAVPLYAWYDYNNPEKTYPSNKLYFTYNGNNWLIDDGSIKLIEMIEK